MSSSTIAVSSLVLQYCPEFAEEQTATAAAPLQLASQQQVLQVVKTVFNRAAIVTRLYFDAFEKREKAFVQQWSDRLTRIRGAFHLYDKSLSRKWPASAPAFRHAFQTKEYNHPANSQEMILKGCQGLDPSKAVIVVCGAQFYSSQAGKTHFVEPLPKMLRCCAQLILVDQDEGTLTTLKEKLKSKKVTTVAYDLSKGLMRDWLEFATRWAAEKDLEVIVKRIEQFCMEATAKMQALLLPILPYGKVADYVVSSLVSSELGFRLLKEIESFLNLKLGMGEDPQTWRDLYPALSNLLNTLCIDFQLLHVRDITAMAKRVYYADHLTEAYSSHKKIRELWDEHLKAYDNHNWYWVRGEQFLKIHACLMAPDLKQDGKVDAPSKKK